MTKATLTLDGKRFVVLPETEYRKLKARAGAVAEVKSVARRSRTTSSRDATDAAEARRRLANPKRIAAADVFKKLEL